MRLPSDLPPCYAPLRQREATVNGHRIAYTEAGEGPPLLVLHGAIFGGNVFWWENQCGLAGHYRTIAPDFPGWGASDKPALDYTVDFYHDFIRGFLDALGLAKVAIVGHSMGGLLGASFALRHPERVERLVTVAAPLVWAEFQVPWLFQPFTVPGLGELAMHTLPLLGPDFPFGVRLFYELLFHAPREVAPDRMRRAMAGCCEATADPEHRTAFLSTMRANLAMFGPGVTSPFYALLDRATFPVMIVAGRQDRLFPLALIERGATMLPAARFEIIEECGHFPMWERAAALESLLTAFLSETAAASAIPLAS